VWALRIFKTKWFGRFAHKQDIDDGSLRRAIEQAERGKVDADLGGGVVKQRISRHNEGKSGGYRSIICYRRGERAIFVYGFAKNARENIDADETRAFKALAKQLLNYDAAAIEAAIKGGALQEVIKT